MRSNSWKRALALSVAGPSILMAQVEEARISNLAIRAVGGGGTPLVADFTVGGGAEKPVLIRAVGPSLADFGITNTLVDPKLAVFDAHGVKMAENDDFSSAIETIFPVAGAFPLRSGGKDAALIASLPTGRYSAEVHGNGAGSTLLEVYDASGGTPQISHVVTRTNITSEADPVLTGFTISPGSAPQRLLIRAVGPALASMGEATAAVLRDPKIEIYAGPVKVAENDNWSAGWEERYSFPSSLTQAFAQSGAVTLPLNSLDAALIHEFSEGSYTVVTRSVGQGAGNVRLEILPLRPPLAPDPYAPVGILGLADFTVSVEKVGELYEYSPKFRFLEIGREWSVIIMQVQWTAEREGVVERLGAWLIDRKIPRGGALSIPEENSSAGVAVGRRIVSPHPFSRMSVRIQYMDDDINVGYLEAVARMIREP